MEIAVVEMLWLAAGLYGLIGIALLIPFHMRALNAIDDGTVGSGYGFRVVVSPSLVALWPVVVKRWISARRGGRFNAAPDKPVSATAIRRIQKHTTRAVAVLAPVAVGLALAGRTAPSSVAPPPSYPAAVALHDGRAFTGLPIRYETHHDGRLLVNVAADLELPTTVLYLDPNPGESLSDAAVVLGGIWGPASFVFELPKDLRGGGILKVFSLADGTVVSESEPLSLGETRS